MELLGIGEELARRGHDVYMSMAKRLTEETTKPSRFMTRQNIKQINYDLKKDYTFIDNLDKKKWWKTCSRQTLSIRLSLIVYLST